MRLLNEGLRRSSQRIHEETRHPHSNMAKFLPEAPHTETRYTPLNTPVNPGRTRSLSDRLFQKAVELRSLIAGVGIDLNLIRVGAGEHAYIPPECLVG